MTLTNSPFTINSEERVKDFRKDMMRVMSEVSFNPANVIPERQEELALFMVSELRSFYES